MPPRLAAPANWTQQQDDPAAAKTAQGRAEVIWNASAATMRTELGRLSAQANDDAKRHRWVALLLALPNPAAAFTAAADNLCGTGDRIGDRWQQTTDT